MDNENRAVSPERLRKFTALLQKYKTGKASLERRVIAAENWWRLRNRFEESRQGLSDDGGFRSSSGWLHNVIVSKHADAMDAYPEPVILPREPDDAAGASLLSAVIPCVLEQNRFEKTYDQAMWQKLKTGTAVYRITWDSGKLGGLGDIAIERVDLLNLFWEPGISDIQESPCFFCTHLENSAELEEQYPQLRGKTKGDSFRATSFVYEDAVDSRDKTTVIEVYYKKRVAGRKVLHYCKYAGDTVLEATEDSADERVRTEGLYAHGRYPFVFDALFPVEASPCGYGFVDLGHNAQTSIDIMRTAFVKNTMVGAIPRYFQRIDGSVNEEEFVDLTKPIVHVSGNLGEDSLRQIGFSGLPGIYMQVLESTIKELRETTGNTETSTGTVNSGVTAASAIAALQEASGKGSRDATRASYVAYSELVELCIELIRQFYTLPRQFRISGRLGQEEFVSFSNSVLQPRPVCDPWGQELGFCEPIFDVKVSAQKRNAYSRLSQNELAMELYRMGIFENGREEQAMNCLELMDFDGKDRLLRNLSKARQEREREQALIQELALMNAARAPMPEERGRGEEIPAPPPHMP